MFLERGLKQFFFNRLTQHSGCPVLEGEKRIVTQWIRLGVSEETPWDSFDTCE